MAYIYYGDILCGRCAEDVMYTLKADGEPDMGDSDTYPQGSFPDGGGESDSPQHCGYCGEFLENPLTPEGIEYVREAIINDSMQGRVKTIAQTVWASFYADELGDIDK